MINNPVYKESKYFTKYFKRVREDSSSRFDLVYSSISPYQHRPKNKCSTGVPYFSIPLVTNYMPCRHSRLQYAGLAIDFNLFPSRYQHCRRRCSILSGPFEVPHSSSRAYRMRNRDPESLRKWAIFPGGQRDTAKTPKEEDQTGVLPADHVGSVHRSSQPLTSLAVAYGTYEVNSTTIKRDK